MQKLKLVKRQNRKRKPIARPLNLTPAEQAEADRFKALTKARAARQAKVRRIKKQMQHQHDSVRAA